jgi:ATP-dependent protease ClpP protease subunit
VNYEYVQNPNAKRPIILLDRYIGTNVGGQFAREILALKNSGVSEAELWINSKGGLWSEGVNMVGAMRNSGIDFTTINMGYVDSTAGHIFQQGNTRKWMPYGLGLVHEIQGSATPEIMESMNNSVATMLSEKSKISVGEVRGLMSKDGVGTLMDYEMAARLGFCDEVLPCYDIMAFTNSSDANEIHEFGQQQIKKALPKNTSMELNSILGLANEASETAQVSAIKAIMDARNAADAKVLALTTSLTTTTTALTETTNRLTEAEGRILEAENAAKQTNADALIAEHKGKRISEDAAVVAQWTKMAVADYEGTKTILEGLNVNVTAPNPLEVTNANPAPQTMAAVMAMRDMENKKKRK